MAMNFWEAQKRARSRTTLYVVIFVLLTLAVAFFSEAAMRLIAGDDYNPEIPFVGLAYLTITFIAAGFHYLMMCSYGGSYVAESVGGRRIELNTTDFKERQILNIVEEMAIAASLPTPPVYLLNSQPINAFAAGLTQDDAAITLTEGAIQSLSREELQGVVAHEFGHIYNGDMKISMRLAAMVMGFFIVLWFALRLMQFSSFRGKGKDKGGQLVVLAAFILMLAGAITWFAGNILKCSISREREYLADACAVQFTRSPDGIAGALKKIAAESEHKMPEDGMAISHMYLDNKVGIHSLFATHPPIEKRIAAIEAREYIPQEWNIPPGNLQN